MSSFSKSHNGVNRDETLISRLATVFPFAKLRQRDLPDYVSEYKAEMSEFQFDESPDRWHRVVGLIPRLIGLMHTISSTDLSIVEYTTVEGDLDYLIHFPLPPVVVHTTEDEKVVPSVDLFSYKAWCDALEPKDRVLGADPTMTAFMRRMIELSKWRYRGFAANSWGELVNKFMSVQLGNAYKDLFEYFIVKERKEVVDIVAFSAKIEKYFIPVRASLQDLYRSLMILDPSTIDQWVDKSVEQAVDGDDASLRQDSLLSQPDDEVKVIPIKKKTTKLKNASRV